MPECHWQHYNPAHLIFPFSVLFEWGLSPPAHLPVFDTLMQMKCPSWGEYLFDWEWARIIQEASLAPLLEKGYFGKIAQKEALAFARSDVDTTNTNGGISSYPAPRAESRPYSYMLSPELREKPEVPGYEGWGSRGREHRLICFDTLYIVQRWGILMTNKEIAKTFREKAISTFNKRYPHEVIDSTSTLTNDPKSIHERCSTNSLRILIHQRSPAHGDRVFLNSPDVLAAASNFTTHARNVHMYIARFPEQVAMYNSFDILVTTTGSHLTNLIFTNRSNVVIVEVGLAVRDWFWRDNAYRFGIRHYLYSHNGHTPSRKCYDEKKVDTTCYPHDTEEDAIICPPRGQDNWHPIGDCSLTVNITVLKLKLQRAIDRLCSSVAVS